MRHRGTSRRSPEQDCGLNANQIVDVMQIRARLWKKQEEIGPYGEAEEEENFTRRRRVSK